MDCTPKCRFVKHAELILSAITKEDASTAFALLPRVCKNFARVGDQFGRNALHLAASCGKVDLLEWLVKEHSVDLEWKDEESGWTSLHRSLFYGHLNCAVKLLQFGSNLSCFDNEGLSPLDLVRLDSPFQVTTGVEAQVLAPYETRLEDELSLQIGDVIDNIHMTDMAYWTGELNGKRGLFPRSCVELLSKDHSLELLTWGANTNFTLGHRDESTRHVPEMVDSIEGGGKTVNIKEVVMCKFHSVFLSLDGRVFTCGHGRGGRLGLGDEKTVLALQEVAALQGRKCVVIAAGQDHTIVVTNDGTVYTFGLNDSYQLGQSPPPTQCLLPRMVQLKVWKTKRIVGAVAGRYHSVFFTRNEVYTCGLNAGQLGHSKGEKYQILPRQVSCLAHNDIKISVVACSDGATVCTTDKGDVFLLNQYICRKIVTRFVELTRLTVVGGQLDFVSSQEVGKKFADELTITMLNSKGKISQWKPQFGSVQQCRWSYSRPITVRDFAVGKQLLIVSDDGEAFICHPRNTQSSPGKSERSKGARSPSLSSCPTDFHLTQSPPGSSPVGQIIKSDAPTPSEPNTSPLGRLVEGTIRKDTVDFLLERISLIHRGKRIFTDSKCRGFAALQVSSKEGLKELPIVGQGQLWYHFSQLLEEASCEDSIHDVEFLVNGKAIPAHSFMLASRSPACHRLLVENKDNLTDQKKGGIRTIQLEDTMNQGAVKQWLKRLYCGEKVNDKEVFFRPITVNNKNGYQVVKTNKGGEKQLPKRYTDKVAKDTAKISEVCNGYITTDPSLEALVCLSRSDLDDLSTPVLENDILAEETNVKRSENPHATSLVARERQIASPSCISREKSFTFSRLNSPELCDVVIVAVGGVEFPCHKCVLIARLEYFRSMLACGWLEASRERKTLTLAVPPNLLEIVLDFLYSDRAPRLEDETDLELLGNVLVVADQLLIARLKEICEEVIAKLITLKNAAELLEFSLLYNANQLQNVCTEFVCNNLASLLEAGCLNVLSDEGLSEISKFYQQSVPEMAWRMITPLNLHNSIVLETNEANYAKRKKSATRKKSSKSESESESLTETGKETNAVKNDNETIQNSDDVFQVEGKLGEIKENEIRPRASANGTDSEQQLAISSQVTHDLGRWYRKHSPEGANHKRNKSKNNLLEAKASVEFPSENEEALEKVANVAKKVSSPTEPAWSLMSACKPPATNFKAIIEQEESQAVRVDNPVTQKLSPSSKPNQRSVTGPQGVAVHWNSSSRQSQKQRKRSKSNSLEDVSDSSKVSEAKTILKRAEKRDEKGPTAWGGVNKKPAPVMSLRDLMQEEEELQNSESAESVLSTSPSFGKSRCPRKKLDWRPRRDFHRNCSDAETKEIFDQHEHAESDSLSPPKRAWQSNHLPGSPPSPTVTFSEILESQHEENANMDKVRRKPFHLTQLEEQAMEELLEHYGGRFNPCELISVQRIPVAEARPRWREESSPSIASG